MKDQSVSCGKGKNSLFFLSAVFIAILLFAVSSAHSASLSWKEYIYGWVSMKNLALGHDGTIYVPVTTANASERYKLYAYNSNGNLRWTFDTTKTVNGTPAIGPDGTIYMGSKDEALYAIRPTDGHEVWNCPVQGNTRFGPAIGSDGTIYIGSTGINNSGGVLNAVDKVTGHIKWTYPFPAGSSPDHSPVVGRDGTIYVMVRESGWARLHAFTSDLTLRWSSPDSVSGDTHQPSIGACGTIYVSTSEAVHAFHPEDGSLQWSQFIPTYQSSVAIGTDGTLYIGSTDDHMYALNPGDGSVKWSRSAGGAVTAGPVVTSDGSIIFGSSDHTLYSIYPSGALVKWTYDTGETLHACPVIADDGTIYAVSYNMANNYLYAIEDNSGPATDSPWFKAGGNNLNAANKGYFPKSVSPEDYALIQPVTNGSVSFEWDNLSFASGYKFQCSSHPGFDQAQTSTLSSFETAIDSGDFEVGREYFWRVAVTAPNVEETYGPSHSFFYGTPLIKAVVFAPVYGALVPTPVYMSWGYPGAAQYALQVATDSNFTQLVFSNWVTSTGGYLGLAADTTYYMRVYPADAAGTPLVNYWSNIYPFTTAP